jgi:hypothetical protein
MVSSLLERLAVSVFLYLIVVLRERIATGGKPRTRVGYWVAGFLFDRNRKFASKVVLALINWAIPLFIIELLVYCSHDGRWDGNR